MAKSELATCHGMRPMFHKVFVPGKNVSQVYYICPVCGKRTSYQRKKADAVREWNGICGKL